MGQEGKLGSDYLGETGPGAGACHLVGVAAQHHDLPLPKPGI